MTQGELYENLKTQINETCVSQSTKCADVCRQIVFAMFAVIGAFSFNAGSFSPNGWFLIALFSLILYLVLDICRYFYCLGEFNKFWSVIKKARKDDEKYEEVVMSILKRSSI